MNSLISFFSGITFRAPFFDVIIDAPAFANASISFKLSYVNFSSPCSKMQANMHPSKVSPAPVVSIVSSLTNGSAYAIISL